MHIFVCEGLWEKAIGLEGGLGALEGSSFWPPDSLPCREGWSHGVGQKMGGALEPKTKAETPLTKDEGRTASSPWDCRAGPQAGQYCLDCLLQGASGHQ